MAVDVKHNNDAPEVIEVSDDEDVELLGVKRQISVIVIEESNGEDSDSANNRFTEITSSEINARRKAGTKRKRGDEIIINSPHRKQAKYLASSGAERSNHVEGHQEGDLSEKSSSSEPSRAPSFPHDKENITSKLTSHGQAHKRGGFCMDGPGTSRTTHTCQNDHSSRDLRTKKHSLKEDHKHAEIQLPSVVYLSKFTQIVFVDLDNWGKFLRISHEIPVDAFVWCFCGGNNNMIKAKLPIVKKLQAGKRFFLHPMCGATQNAADFALCIQAAKLDLQLPKHIPFTVLSGDKGFGELRNQLSSSSRKVHLVNPHHQDLDIVKTLLKSIGDR